jgi:site-specific DNA recombinase
MSCVVSTAHEIADREGINERYVGKVIMLAFLSPEITTAIIEGTQPADLTTERLIRDLDLPLDWQSQAALLTGA